MLNLVTYPNDILRKKAQEVKKFSPDIQDYINQMLVLMKTHKGIGLAANQAGILHRIICVDTTSHGTNGIHEAMVNPEIINKSKDTIRFKEGCLSFPNSMIEVERSKEILLSYMDINGNQTIKYLNGLSAICAQHEIDHLDGILFIDYDDLTKRGD